MEEGCQGRGEKGMGKGGERNGQRVIRVSFSLQNHLMTFPLLFHQLKLRRVTSWRDSPVHFSIFSVPVFNCILLLLLLSLTHHPHPFNSSSVHTSLSLGLASVGRFQSVCLLMTPLGTDVMFSSCCSAASLSHPYLSLPALQCLLCIYLHAFLFAALPLLNC